MSLDEHLIIYFMETQPKHARNQVERSILDFLASLKYYSDNWKRARTFALMYGFLQADDSFLAARRSGTSDTRHPHRLNDGKVGELDIPYSDIHLQEFFLQCYCITSKERHNFLESPEGYTYMPLRFQEGLAKKILAPFVENQQMFKWAQKIKSAVKRTKLSELDDNDSEYLDIDNLLSLFLEEFKTVKKAFSKILNKQFGRVI